MKKIFSIITVIVVLLVCMLIADQGNLSIAVNGSNIIDLVYLIIFVFIVNFFVNKKSWSPKAQKEIKTAIIVYCCFNFYMVSTNFGVMCIKKSSINSRQKACLSNMRVLEGAIEMYDIDHFDTMKELDIPTLIKEKYLNREPSKPEEDCYYYISGDLTKEGVIYCTHHLTLISNHANQNIIDDFENGHYYTNDYITQEMIDIIKQKKAEIENKKTFTEKIQCSWKKKWPTIKNLLSPILILFFPFTLHPLRD